MSFDAAIIGSGPNGLAAAIRLAQAGWSVVVYEARETVGGGARTAELTLPGFRHDICSAIHPMGIGSPYLATLPLADHGLQWVQPGAPLAHPFDDGPAAILHRELELTGTTLGQDGASWATLMGPFAARWEELARDGMGPLGLPKSPFLMARFGLSAMRSATDLARARFDGPRAKALFGGLAAHSVLPLDQVPSAAIGLMLGVAAHAVGWPMPRGGSQSLSEAMASLLVELGGTIRTGVRIGELGAIETGGPVLFDTSTHALSTIAGDALPPGFHKKLGAYRYGPGVFKVDWALSGPIPWADPAVAQAGTVHLGGSLDELAASERAAFDGEHSDRPYVLLAQQSLFDDSRAPAGKHTGWAYCHVPHGSTVDRTAIIEAQVERFAPGFGDLIEARHTMNTADFFAHNENYVGGDINGGVPDLAQLFTRPTARFVPHSTPNKRLWLCSAATPPGGGVHGMGGFHAAEALLRSHGEIR